jgi:RNA polymerase sigma-70 factor (ECF subfamily)
VRLWKALESEREIENLTSYLYKIAATATIDAVRHALSRNEEQLQLVGSDNEGGKVIALTAEPSKSPESLAEKRELMRKIENAMARLPDNRRRAVGLHLQGLSSREIADVLSWSEPKARNLLYRGLRNLRALLRAEGVEYEE